MRGDAELGHSMQLMSADLDLDRLTGVRDHRRVQRLVAVGLRHCDVILEAARHGLPEGMDDAEHTVAITHRVHLDADGRQVVDLGEVLLLAGHLLPYRVDVRGWAGDLGLDPDVIELTSEDLAQVRDQGLALVALARDALDDVFVCLRLQVAEGQVLELPLELPDAEAMRQRGVYVEGLAGDLAALDLGQGI